MKFAFTIVLFSIGILRSGLAQEVSKSKGVDFSITPQMGHLVSSAPTAHTTYRFGIRAEVLKEVGISPRASFFFGPSIQSGSVSNRTNAFRWPADSKDGEWVPGLSFEDFRTNFIALGGTASLIYNLSAEKQTWNISAGSSVRYIVHHNDKLILNESGFIREQDPADFGLKVSPFQVLLDLGVNYSIPVNSHYLSIGPQIEYGITSLIEETISNFWQTAHLSFFGLRVIYQ